MSPLGALALGISIGFVFGGYVFRWLADKDLAGLRRQRDEARDNARRDWGRAMNMHRRAQKAEGRLQRVNHILAEADEE